MGRYVELIGNICRGLGAVCSSDKRRRYLATTVIDAPQSLVWRVSSRTLISELEEDTGMTWSGKSRNDGSGIVDLRAQNGVFDYALSYRVIDERSPEAQLIEILPEGENAYIRSGRDYYVAFKLRPEGERTELTMSHELTHAGWRGYVMAPLLPFAAARYVKSRSEKDAGTEAFNRSFALGAVATGVLTLASFVPWFGFSGAAMLIALIFIHELGHVVAMRSLGLPVRGLYFLPFVGGVAVGAAARTEAERGFVSLMGPGLSLVTTALLYLTAISSGSADVAYLTLLSALLNGFNLLPVMPLDGGHVLEALLSRIDAGVLGLIKMCLLLLALGVALYAGSTIMTVLFALALPSVLATPNDRQRLPAVCVVEGRALAVAYAGAMAFYALVAAALTAGPAGAAQ